MRCWLCGTTQYWVLRGLATFGINYPGEVRFICDACVSKIRRRS